MPIGVGRISQNANEQSNSYQSIVMFSSSEPDEPEVHTRDTHAGDDACSPDMRSAVAAESDMRSRFKVQSGPIEQLRRRPVPAVSVGFRSSVGVDLVRRISIAMSIIRRERFMFVT